MRTAENMSNKPKPVNSEVRHIEMDMGTIEDIVSKEIEEHKLNLEQVNNCIEEISGKSLSGTDKSQIASKYIECCQNIWLKETIDLLEKLTESKSHAIIQDIFSSLDNRPIQSLKDVPNPFKQLEYYKLLIEHYKLVSKEDEKTLVRRFKKECLEQILAFSDSAEKELLFLESLVEFLSSSKNLKSFNVIIAKLKLEDFCRGDLLFDGLINNIMKLEVDTYGENLTVLQKATEGLKEENDVFLSDKFKEVIGSYIIKPVEIQGRKIDGRLVIEVTGKNIIASEILRQLENELSKNSNIEEVHFVGADIIHIDADFTNNVWHGKNIAILTKTIKIHDKVTWDVSGKDNDHIYSDNAGTGEDGHGKQGKDGHSGESGGNVLIIAEKIDAPENFTIISNGGKGSKGQDGGDGKNGEDGKGISKTEFDEKFPAVATCSLALRTNDRKMYKTVTSIKNESQVITSEWYETARHRSFAIRDVTYHNENAIEEVMKYFEHNIPVHNFEGNIFINAMTNQGNEIIFSYESGGYTTICQAFLVYKGSLGQPGGQGGEYGLGGEGGYAGEIKIECMQGLSVVGSTLEGKEGEKGQGGLYGNHGKNGWDMGYADYSISTFFTEKWPKFYGIGENSKLDIKYYNASSSRRIKCPYRERKGNQYMFAEIEGCIIEHKQQKKYEERKSTRQSNDRKHHAQAVRKKNISQSSILDNYSHHFSSIETNTLQDLRSDLESTKQQALQAITENQKQQEKQTTELRIKRHVNSTYQSKSKHNNDITTATFSTVYRETIDVENLIDKFKNNKSPLDDWFQLKSIELSLSQLSQLFSIFEDVKSSSTETKSSQLQDVEKLLMNKYRFATLQEIGKQLPHYITTIGDSDLTPKSTARYLIEAKENDSNISHPILGTLNQYLYENNKEQREKISKFSKEELQNTNSEILKCSMRAFILEVGNSKEVNQDIKMYHDKYQHFLKKQDLGFIVFPESFNKLDDDCCKDESVFTEHAKYIEEIGLSSESYREFLAYAFDINIRLYVEDQDSKLLLQDIHNSLARPRPIINVLRRGDEFIQLHIDKNYLGLEEERKMKDDLYAKIFVEIEPFKQKQEFDDYLKSKAFLSRPNNSPSEDEQSFNEEKEDIEKIIEYFPKEKRQQIKVRLEKITFQYTGQKGILHSILKRFSSEGKHVSLQELCYLVNSVLASSIDDRKEQNTFHWIIAAYPQKNWIDELILLQLENYFKKPLEVKSKWREYLSKIENKNIVSLFYDKLDQCRVGSFSTNCIQNILYLLSNIPNEPVSLGGLELSEWPYAIKEKYWSYKLSQLTSYQESEKLPTATYYLLSVENAFGTELVEEFLKFLEKKKQELSPATLTDILSNFHHEKWNLSEDALNTLNTSKNISEWVGKMQQKYTTDDEKNVRQLVELIQSNANTSKGISDKLSRIKDSIESICKEEYATAGKPVSSFTENDIKIWVVKFQGNNNKRRQGIEKEILAITDRAIEIKRGFKLRDTQKLTVLALLTNDRNTLAQVSTGEGKSLIVVAASIMIALCGEKVDIVTSSSVLAKRDAEDYRDIYSLFDIDVSHNCSEDIDKRKEAYSGNQVVYGDLSNFQRDYLLDKFYGKNILGDHNFANVIVDEVDSMLLDKGNNMLYLSHDLPALDKLQFVYIYIWQWINRPARDHEEFLYAFNVKAIKEAVLNDLYGLIKKEDIGTELSGQQKSIIWERLIKAEILDGDGKLLKENINDSILNEVLSPEFNSYKDRLDFLLKECIGREKYIHIPNHLRPFVEQHLEFWINSAISAFFMKPGQDYVVDVDRSGTSPDRNPNITILDRDTGTDQVNSQWDEALHQFLQLKHGCKLSLQSLKAVFVSNVSFFKLYNHLYGLTGTLGSQRERDLLQEIHGVDFVTIPTAKSKQFREDKPIICTSKEEWINHIHVEVKNLTEEKKRSVLIICETVNDVETLHKAFGGKDAKHVHTYTRDYEESNIARGTKELEQGQIIIATNLAGRGTDIKITKKLSEAGGLHVCLTYLPNNIRIEQQAFGRAARSGDEGSGQLIIMDTKGQKYSNSKILDLKKERNAEELGRISDIKAYYETQITKEENCFKMFKEQYEQLKKDLDDKELPTEVKEILMQSCLDKWSFWLDENSKCIRNMTDEQSERNLNSLLNKFISQLKNLETGFSEKWLPSDDDMSPPVIIVEYDSNSWLAWVEGNPVQMVKLGRYLSQNEKHKNAHGNAIELFDEVIIKEQYHSEAAHYYKAFALAKKIDWEKMPLRAEKKQTLKELKKELRKAASLLDEHSKFAINAAGIIGKIKKNNNESIIPINAYEEQQKSLANLYYIFSQSIEDILGHFITPQSFVNSDIKERLAKVLYEDLLGGGVLKRPRVKKSISEEELKTISSDYGVSAKILQHFLSKYEGRTIDEKEFLKELKKDVQLPSRNIFWKFLIEQKVLIKEVKYITIVNEKLREIDPSLLDFLTEIVDKKELKKQTLETINEQILFSNSEGITQQNNDYCVFEKNDFIKTVGKTKYEALKEKGVLSFNKKAHIDPSKIKSATFSCSDSITREDFAKVNITNSEAEKILAELVEQKVLEKKDDSENSAYVLKIKFDELKQVQLLSCQVYENVVKGLLAVSFTYRIALQQIARQLEEKNFPIHLHLTTKPHQSLVLELLHHKIIRPTMVTTKDKEKLKSIYSQTMTKENLKLMLSQDKLIPKECTEKLFNCLIEKKWIVQKQFLPEDCTSPIANDLLKRDLYYINSPDKRQRPLNFSPEESHKNALTKSQSIDKTLGKVLDNRLQLIKGETIKNVIATLGRSRSSLKALKVPDPKLKPLTEFCGQSEFANIEEVRVFFLNGLDQILQLDEKKWTGEMLRNTAIVVAMGISQIAIGTVIELYSMGVMTHVGATFVNEGVNDLFYAVEAFKSGYFSWEDYRQQKLHSLMMAVVTVGIGAYLSRGSKVSRFGLKLAGPNFEYGKKVAEMTGTQLIKTAGWKVVGKEVAKRIMLKASEGIAFGLASAGVDTIVNNHIQGLCQSISSSILLCIGPEVEKHEVSARLKEVYETFGKEKARKIVNELTKSVFTEQHCVEKFLPIANRIASSITHGIAEASKKKSKVGKKIKLPIDNISKIVVWSERCAHIAKIPLITSSLLNNLDQKIKGKLKNDSKLEKNTERDLPNQKQKQTEQDFERFKKEVIDQWKSLLDERAREIISRHIVSPILKEGANHLVRYVGRKIGEAYQSCKESENLEYFKELKPEYEENPQNEEQHDNISETKDHITEKYHEGLLKFMIKTRNPTLFAAIIREGTPMDYTCVSACTRVIYKILREQGVLIPGISIIIKGDCGTREDFPPMSEGTGRLIITIDLKDNHFEFGGSSTPQNNKSESKNNCLYEALSEAIPELRKIISPEKFRAEIANCIEQDPEIQNHIKQGWHQLALSLGAYGGGNKFSNKRLHDRLQPYGTKLGEIGESGTEWKSLKDNRIDEPHEFKEQKQRELNKLPKDIRDRLGNTLALHHIIPLSKIRDFLTIAAKDERGLQVIHAWANAAGLSEKDNTHLHAYIKKNICLDAGDNPENEGFKKLFWPKFNLVYGPSKDRVDDPGSEMEWFSSSKHPENLREMGKNLEFVGDIFDHVIRSGKLDLTNETCGQLTSSINKIRDDFTSKNKAIFSFVDNWQLNDVSGKWGRISTQKIHIAGNNTKYYEVIVRKEKEGGIYNKLIRSRSSERESKTERKKGKTCTSSLLRNEPSPDLNNESTDDYITLYTRGPLRFENAKYGENVRKEKEGRIDNKLIRSRSSERESKTERKKKKEG